MADADGPDGAFRDHFVQLCPAHIEQLRCPAHFEEQLHTRSEIGTRHESSVGRIDNLVNIMHYSFNMSMETRSIFIPGVTVPKTVGVAEDDLTYTFSRAHLERYVDGRRAVVRPTDASLLRFSRLSDAASVSDYGKHYGVLRAAQIDSSSSEREQITLPNGTAWELGVNDPAPFEKVDEHRREPLALWFMLAGRLRAILRINASLQGRTRSPLPTVGSLQDWRTLGWPDPYPMEDVTDAQFLLLAEVNHWLRLGKVGLELGITKWSKQKTEWNVGIAYKHLLGGLAYRLLLMVAGENRLYACDNCQIPYIRMARAPRPGQENFCEDCSDVAKRRATQRYRERRSAKGKK